MGKRKSSPPVAVDKKKRKPRPAVSGDKKKRKSSSPVAGDKKKRKPRSAVSGDKEKRKPRSDTSETLVSCKRRRGRKDKKTVVSEEEKGGFFACYLLASLSPRHKGHTYIGFTVNPRRRIRQHNGEIGSGASRTKAKRPWEMVFCIYGFPTHVSALQFEWAWQHPKESLAVRDTAATFKSLSGLANKIKLGHTMLTLPSWHNLHLTVNFFSTKYTMHSAGCPSLPEHTRVQVSAMDELPCYTGTDHNNIFDDEGDRDDYEMCINISREYRSLTEGSTTAKVDTCRDHWKSTEEPTHDQNGLPEDTSTRQSGDLLSSTDGHRQPLFTSTSPEQVSYPFSSCMFSALGTENRDVVASREENGVELNQPVSNQLQTPRAADTDQQEVSEVEVIDLLSPSPDYNITFSRKKRKFSTVCPQMIDLTESPIFV